MTIQPIILGPVPDDGTGDSARTAGSKINANFAELLATKADGTATTAALAAKAPLASPALTGVPTAPTAALGTNTGQVATMAAIKNAIDALVGGAPGALDTLAELATALASDASFAATMTTLLAAKAPLASPTFTGTVAVPAIAGTTDNSTKAATTAFVQAVIAALAAPILSKSFTSGQLTITSAGVGTVAHGMATVPKIVAAHLVCTTAYPLGQYLVGDIIPIDVGWQGTVRGVALKVDATNIAYQFGNATNVFQVNDPTPATAGADLLLTNANFKLVLKAFA